MGNDVMIIGFGTVGAGSFEKVTINGTGSIAGSITAESFHVNGVAKANEDIAAEKIEVNGTLSGHSLKGKKIVIRGLAELTGKIEGEMLDLNGSFKAESVNCDKVDITLRGFGNVREIVGSKVEVKVKEPIITLFSIQIKPSILKAELIEADEIFLENTEADVVCGTQITIGKGCKIKRVEYKQNLKVSNDAAVDQIVKD